jgi:hypothetical protein
MKKGGIDYTRIQSTEQSRSFCEVVGVIRRSKKAMLQVRDDKGNSLQSSAIPVGVSV